MIWYSQDISTTENQAETFIAEYISSQSLPDFAEKSVFRIGIIGGGPKGLYALDSLIDSLNSLDIEESVEIYWFNSSTKFGCGPNFDPHQPDYLLINNCIGQVDAWSRDREEDADKYFPDLVQWLNRIKASKVLVRPTDFASRAVVGRYLQEVAAHVIQSVPSHVRLFLVVDTVEGIEDSDGFKLNLSSGQFQFPLDNVMLTTGHCYSNPSLINDDENDTSNRRQNYITDIWSSDQLNKISAGKAVGIAGMGLTFIDIALHLTEGRGGVFEENGDYIPSGNEPIIYPFSRSGQPILPRAAAFGHGRYRLRFLNETWVREMREIRRHRKVDFFEEILPILEKEVSYAYFSTLLGTDNLNAINLFVSDTENFELQNLLFGIIESGEKRHQSVLDFLSFGVSEAEQGEKNSPMLAAMAVWREAVPLIGEFYSYGGLTGESQMKLDKTLLGALNRTSFGPPVENMKKIIALAKAGIIQFDLGKAVNVTLFGEDEFQLNSGTTVQNVSFLIDARVARPQLENENSPLYRQLFKANLIESYSNQGYMPGCVSMDMNGQSTVKSPDSPPLFFYGSNTEGILLDNDSLSRTRNNLANPWAEFTRNQVPKTKYIQNELSFR